MKATISMDALYDFLKSLSLGSDNERWLAEKLLDDAEAHEKEQCLASYTVEEIYERIRRSEEDFAAGRTYSSEEVHREMQEYIESL